MIKKCAVYGIWGCQELSFVCPVSEEPPENDYLVFYRQGNVKRIFIKEMDKQKPATKKNLRDCKPGRKNIMHSGMQK